MTIQRNLFARREICRISGPPPRRRPETRGTRASSGRTSVSGSFLTPDHRGRGRGDGAGAELLELPEQLVVAALGRAEPLPQLPIVLEDVPPKAGLGVVVVLPCGAVLAVPGGEKGGHHREHRDEHRPDRRRETREQPIQPPHVLSPIPPISRTARAADRCCRRPPP